MVNHALPPPYHWYNFIWHKMSHTYITHCHNTCPFTWMLRLSVLIVLPSPCCKTPLFLTPPAILLVSYPPWQTCMQGCAVLIYSSICSSINLTPTHPHTHISTHPYLPILTHTYPHFPTCAHTYPPTHAHTHTCTHTQHSHPTHTTRVALLSSHA